MEFSLFYRLGNTKRPLFSEMPLSKLSIAAIKVVSKWGASPCILSIMHPMQVFKIDDLAQNRLIALIDL